MRASEDLIVLFFAYVALMALVLPLPGSRRLAALMTSGGSVAASLLLAATDAAWPTARIVRDWTPGAQLLLGYWVSGLLFVQPRLHIESWFEALDLELFDWLGIDRFIATAPRPILEYLEASYLSCYAVVPGGLAVLYGAGLGSEADRYWTGVLAAEFACYGMLPWVPTRPPRAIDPADRLAGRRLFFRRLNLAILRRASIQVNTFPSAHAAGAFAAALMVGAAWPGAGVALGLVAASIAIGSVLGRYHYAIDAAVGIATAIMAWALAR